MDKKIVYKRDKDIEGDMLGMNSDFIYDLGTVKTIIFNKTNNLALFNPEVLHFTPLNSYEEAKLLNLTAALSEQSEHHICRALRDFAKQKGAETVKLEKVQVMPGRGLKATFEHLRILLGNLALMEQYGVNLAEVKSRLSPHLKSGQTVVLVAVGEEVKGLIVFGHKISSEAKKAVSLIKNSQVNTVLLTGDNHASAKYLANRMNIDRYLGNLSFEDKNAYLEKMRPTENFATFTSDSDSLPDTGVRIIVNPNNIFAAACLIPLSQEVIKSSQRFFLLGAALILVVIVLVLISVLA